MSVLLSLIRLSRPYYLMQAIAPPVAGYLTASQFGFSWKTVFILAIVYSLLGFSAWSVNEIYDKDFDQRGRTKRFHNLYVAGGTKVLSSHPLPRGVLAVSITITVITALILAMFVNVPFLAISTAWIFVGLFYSIPPIRLKGRGIFGATLTALTYGFIGFNAGWLASGVELTSLSLFFGLLMSLVFFGFDGLAHLIDYEDDHLNGIKTFVVELGTEKSKRILAGFQVVPFVCLGTLIPFNYCSVNWLYIPVLFISAVFAFLTLSMIDEKRYFALRILSVPVIAASFFILM